jgi:alanyl-tRNA synthetase
MTERLYYDDSFLREFDARVLHCDAAGERFHVLLDRTAFYPTSGGQPFDTGHLNDALVVEVLDREDGEIIHVTDRAIAVGPAHGEIDWDRRFDHMQQHTGQHLLSAAFIELFKFQTVSFHLGRDISTIDLAAPSIVPRYLEEVERRVNQIIFEDGAIAVSYATAAQLAESGVRKEVKREGVSRVIEVEGFDRQPCGGTHLARTGQVGMLLIRKCERQKQNWRVEFVCGGRALAAAHADFATLSEAAGEFSCGLSEVPAMVRKFAEEQKSSQRAMKKLYERLADSEARAMLAAAEPASSASGVRIIRCVFKDAEARYLSLLANRLAAEPGVRALLATEQGGAVVFAQSVELDGDMGALLRETVSAVGGKGGGRTHFAQGSVPDVSRLEEILELAAQRVRTNG